MSDGIIIRVSGVRVPPLLPFFFKQNCKFLAVTPCFNMSEESNENNRFVTACVTGV